MAAKKKKMVRRTGRKRLTKKQRLKNQQAMMRASLLLIGILAAAFIYWWVTREKPSVIPSVRPTGEAYVTLYFPEKSDTFLVPVRRKISLGKKEDIHFRALKELKYGPSEDPINLLTTIPAGCNIIDVEINGTTAKINFNNRVLDILDETTEKWFFQGVLHTICAFDDIERADFLFEGNRRDALPQGTDISGPRTPDDLNLSYAPGPEGDEARVTLYFPDHSGRYLVPITDRIPNEGSSSDKIIRALKRLLDGPRDMDRTAVSRLFSDGVDIRTKAAIREEDGRLTVALTADDEMLAIVAQPDQVYNALRLTMSQFLTFDEFRIVLNDKPVEELLGIAGNLDTRFAGEYPTILEDEQVQLEEVNEEDYEGNE